MPPQRRRCCWGRTAAPVLDSLGEQGEVISRVARTGGSSTTGDLEAGAWANHPTDGCTSSPATVSTHSGQSQASASDTPNDAADLLEVGDLSPEEHSGCSTDDADPAPPTEAHAIVQPPDAPDLNIEMLRLLISSGCAISKKQGDWPQRICDLRTICSFAEAFAYR